MTTSELAHITMSDIWPNIGDGQLHPAGFDNFAGAFLGLRLAPLVVTPTSGTVPTDIVDCFAQIELFLHDSQAFKERLLPAHSFLNVLPLLLRYRSSDLIHQQKSNLLSLFSDDVSALCLLLADMLAVQRNTDLHHQLLQSWTSRLDAISAQASSPHADEIIRGISSAILYPDHYVIAVTYATQAGGIAPWLTGLLVGNWGGLSAIPLLLQLQIEKDPKAQGLSRSHCRALARQLFNQWAGCRAPNVAYG